MPTFSPECSVQRVASAAREAGPGKRRATRCEATLRAVPENRYTCPCCGHLVFDEPPGSDDICLVCFWQDDENQLRWPELAGGANAVSLREAQATYAELGASEARFVGDVRAPTENEPLDPGWRRMNGTDLFEAPDESAPWPEDRTALYYWRPSYWRIALRTN